MDELNAVLGLALAFIREDAEIHSRLLAIQRDLCALGASMARLTPGEPVTPAPTGGVIAEPLSCVEQWNSDFTAKLSLLRQPILPGGSKGGATLHHARAVCRRAERHLTVLSRQVDLDPLILRYMHCLADFLFVAARLENVRRAYTEIPW